MKLFNTYILFLLSHLFTVCITGESLTSLSDSDTKHPRVEQLELFAIHRLNAYRALANLPPFPESFTYELSEAAADKLNSIPIESLPSCAAHASMQWQDVGDRTPCCPDTQNCLAKYFSHTANAGVHGQHTVFDWILHLTADNIEKAIDFMANSLTHRDVIYTSETVHNVGVVIDAQRLALVITLADMPKETQCIHSSNHIPLISTEPPYHMSPRSEASKSVLMTRPLLSVVVATAAAQSIGFIA